MRRFSYIRSTRQMIRMPGVSVVLWSGQIKSRERNYQKPAIRNPRPDTTLENVHPIILLIVDSLIVDAFTWRLYGPERFDGQFYPLDDYSREAERFNLRSEKYLRKGWHFTHASFAATSERAQFVNECTL